MDQPLNAAAISGFQQTEQMMTQIFGHKVTVPDLTHIAAMASKELSHPSPNKRARRPDLIDWFHRNWDSISSILNETAGVDDPLVDPRTECLSINRRFAIDHATHWPKNSPQQNVASGEPRRSGREERKDDLTGLRRSSARKTAGWLGETRYFRVWRNH
jgi:hypothetical protein